MANQRTARSPWIDFLLEITSSIKLTIKMNLRLILGTYLRELEPKDLKLKIRVRTLIDGFL